MNSRNQELFDKWNVSRETLDRVQIFIDLLYVWQRKINLISCPKNISKDSFDELVWQRHIMDSMQLIPYLENRDILDIGSGGGFPALLLALVHDCQVSMVESDIRKCEFLKEASRKMGLDAVVINDRIENMAPDRLSKSITITARACASVSKLLELTEQLHGIADFILLKGEKAEAELEDARVRWQMTSKCIPSITNEKSSIVMIQGVGPNG